MPWYQNNTITQLKLMTCTSLQAGRFEYACKACGHKAGAKRNLRKHMHAVHPSLLQVIQLNQQTHPNCFTVQHLHLVWVHDPMERQLEASREAARSARGLEPGRLPPLSFLLQVFKSLLRLWHVVKLGSDRRHLFLDTTPWSQRQSENVNSC